MNTSLKRLVIGVSGASGVIYAIRLLKKLAERKDIETYLITSKAVEKIILEETNITLQDLTNLVTASYSENDLDAPLNSGSFLTDGMIIVPCSLKTLAAIALGLSNNVTARAAEVTLKEKRPLILVPRETPLSVAALRNMYRASLNGATILPAMPAFYHKPKDINGLVDYIIGKIFDQLKLRHNLYKRWRESE